MAGVTRSSSQVRAPRRRPLATVAGRCLGTAGRDEGGSSPPAMAPARLQGDGNGAAAGRPPARHSLRRAEGRLRPVGLPALERRVGWQPSLTDHAFALAKQLGSVNAAAPSWEHLAVAAQGLHLARPWEGGPQPGGGPAAGDPGRPPARVAGGRPPRPLTRCLWPSTRAPFPLGIGRPWPGRSSPNAQPAWCWLPGITVGRTG
jgi:hypothetical protein